MHEEHHNDDNGHKESDHGNIQIKSPSSDGANEEDTIYNNQTHCQDRSYNFYRTLYGPGELEMFRHQQLQQSVRDAKLKVYYPGRWGRHSPRARFRIPLFHNDGQANCNHDILNVGEVNTANKKVGSGASLLKFRSNARIISAIWTVPSCNDLNHFHNMRLDHVDETSNQYAGNPSSIDMDCQAVLQDQKSNEEGSLLKKQNRVLQSNQQPPLQQDKNKERTIKLNWESTIQTVCNERVYDHILLLPSKCNSLSNASHNYKDAKNNDQYKLHGNCINCYTDFEGNNCQDGESSVLILELDSRLPNVSAVPIINESNTEVENTRGDKKIVECEKLSEMDKGQHHQTLQNNGAQEEDAISKIQEEGAFDVNYATNKLLDPPPCVTLQCSSSGCNIHGNDNSDNTNHNNRSRNNRHEQHQHSSHQLNLSYADDSFQWECQSYWNNDTAWKWMKVGDNYQKSESNVSDDHGVEDNWIPISSCWNYHLPFSDGSFGHKEEQSKEEIVHRRAQIPMRDADTFWRFPHQMELCDISTVEPVRQIPLCTKSDSQKCTVVHNDCMDDNAVDCNDKDNSSRHYNHTLVYDFGKELLGKVVISIPSSLASLAKIKLRVGETLAEAMNEEHEYYEQSLELCHHYPNDCGATCDTASIVDETKATTLLPLDEKDVHHFWISVHLLAFRYVRVVFGNDCMEIVSASLNNSPPAHVAALDPMACSNVKVVCQAHMPRLTRQGSFSCSDLAGISDNENLDNQIWSSAEYTLKLCVHHNFIVDGIKRDRLPWAGDLAVSLMGKNETSVWSQFDLACYLLTFYCPVFSHTIALSI